MDLPCPSCETVNPAAARFCMACGSPLGAPVAERVQAQERRVVTILFVDLVGFTERSDRADPEDVRRTLVPFHARVKEDIERYGGTLDKFIGDAVMGVFGAPVSHEDDPARAVRAALRILDSIGDLAQADPNLAVRVAVHTGEAVVTFGQGPQVGEAVTGDVVNTASRMQSVAPRNAVVIGPATHRLTRGLFDFEELPAATVKGKAEPLLIWRVVGERIPSDGEESRPPLVGRRHELALLREVFAGVERDGASGFVTVVGEPGIGKSRLIHEFRQEVDGRAGWLVGTCVPYGEDVTFRPVADLIRTLAGIERADEAARARAKLRTLSDAVEPSSSEREWLLGRLEMLVGLGQAAGAAVTGPGGGVPARESAVACARVLAVAAEQRPVVVVLEDVHWAQPILREAIESLADELRDRAVMLLCSARPDPMEADGRRWGAGRPGAATIRLEALTDEDASALLSELQVQAGLPERTRREVVERAAGNPLYALEFARMLSESAETEGGAAGPMPVPETVQAVIAARLDGIPAELRSLTQDAAVVGPAFWPAALAALSGRAEPEVREAIAGLVRRGVVERRASSRLPHQAEFAFTHELIRDVSYRRLPRLARARKHLAAGSWLELAAGDRAPEQADALANHFAQAVDLATTAGALEEAERAREPAVRWLLTAADLASRLDQRGAFALFDRALALAPGGTHERTQALAGSGLMGRRSGALAGPEVLRRYEEALGIERDLGDPSGIGRALVRMGSQLGALGHASRAREALAEAVAVLDTRPPGPELARACAFRAEEEMFSGHPEDARPWAERALELARRFGLEDVTVMALHIRGDARCSGGDGGGLDDLREAARLAEASGQVHDIVISESYVGEWLAAFEGPAAALVHFEAAIALAERRGAIAQWHWARAHAIQALVQGGDWPRALRWSEELMAVGREGLDLTVFSVARTERSHLLLLMGRGDETDRPRELVELARPTEEIQAIAPALVAAAVLAEAAGDAREARSFLGQFEEVTREVAGEYRTTHLAEVVRACAAVGELDLADRLVQESRSVTPRDRLNVDASRAVVAEARGDAGAAEHRYAEAAEGWRTFGCPREEGEALLGRARCLLGLGPGDEALPALDAARELFLRLGASLLVARADAVRTSGHSGT